MPNPRTPLEVRAVTGNPGKRPGLRALQPGALLPSSGRAPTGIRWSPEASAVWRRLWKAREELGLEARVYDLWAELLARHWARAAATPRENRTLADLIASDVSAREVRYLLSEGGLTPAARARLGIAGQGEESDELEDLIGRAERRGAA